jgi:hypothetical protein
MKENINELIQYQNAVIRKWGVDMARKDLPGGVRAAGIKSSTPSKPFGLKVNFYAEKKGGYGPVKRIGFSLSKVGVYQEKGVGRGRGIHSGKTTPKPWFNPTISKNIQELADSLAFITGDTIVANIGLR